MHPHCTRDDTWTTATGTGTPDSTMTRSESAPIMAVSPARPVARRRSRRTALTGPKYRLSNDAGLVTLSRNSSPCRSRRRHCCQDGSGRPQRSAGSTAAEGMPSMRTTRPVIHTSCDVTAPTRLSRRHARRQVAALRGQRGSVWQAAWSRTMLPTDKGRGSELNADGPADRRDTSRPPRCRTGCRSGAAADARRTPRPAQRGHRRTSPPARVERAGASEDAADCWLHRQRRMELRSWQRPPGQPGGVPLGGVFGQRQACAASRLASVRQYAGETATGAMPSASMASMRSNTART